MNVAFLGSYRGKEEIGKYCEIIYKTVSEAGYTHIDSDIVSVPYSEFVSRMKKGKNVAYEKHCTHKLEQVRKADICIFESSIHSLGIGVLIERAIELLKPTILLYFKGHTPYFLAGIHDERVIIREYTARTVKSIVQEALEEVRERRDKRFNLFISPKLLIHLDEMSAKKGLTKSAYVRGLIIEDAKKEKK